MTKKYNGFKHENQNICEWVCFNDIKVSMAMEQHVYYIFIYYRGRQWWGVINFHWFYWKLWSVVPSIINENLINVLLHCHWDFFVIKTNPCSYILIFIFKLLCFWAFFSFSWLSSSKFPLIWFEIVTKMFRMNNKYV